VSKIDSLQLASKTDSSEREHSILKLTENVLHGNKDVDEKVSSPVQEEDEEDLIRSVT
jgi:hypothetical protein